ncbi:unnamed protein product [Vitrella brassicaformis CCMP3155]|uniref:Tyrosine specific protein phosphatases domain-containing protein n=1 Tax=Vitrella brassicaformis (strain CCMP3155) TaxID=1169540 RepID=A0A0G4EBW8_VITBC|nr:unnamed protein product [Vitrella brassicaformis CCMP3155]|eukprot:CEL93155.1 unnamed protein product [Vitrella brassicaformis CCMP3155]
MRAKESVVSSSPAARLSPRRCENDLDATETNTVVQRSPTAATEEGQSDKGEQGGAGDGCGGGAGGEGEGPDVDVGPVDGSGSVQIVSAMERQEETAPQPTAGPKQTTDERGFVRLTDLQHGVAAAGGDAVVDRQPADGSGCEDAEPTGVAAVEEETRPPAVSSLSRRRKLNITLTTDIEDLQEARRIDQEVNPSRSPVQPWDETDPVVPKIKKHLASSVRPVLTAHDSPVNRLGTPGNPFPATVLIGSITAARNPEFVVSASVSLILNLCADAQDSTTQSLSDDDLRAALREAGGTHMTMATMPKRINIYRFRDKELFGQGDNQMSPSEVGRMFDTQFKGLLEATNDPRQTILIHCAMGKSRTGLFATCLLAWYKKDEYIRRQHDMRSRGEDGVKEVFDMALEEAQTYRNVAPRLGFCRMGTIFCRMMRAGSDEVPLMEKVVETLLREEDGTGGSAVAAGGSTFVGGSFPGATTGEEGHQSSSPRSPLLLHGHSSGLVTLPPPLFSANDGPADGPQPPSTPPPPRPTGPSGKTKSTLLQDMDEYPAPADDLSGVGAARGQGEGKGERGRTGSGATLSPVRHSPVKVHFSPGTLTVESIPPPPRQLDGQVTEELSGPPVPLPISPAHLPSKHRQETPEPTHPHPAANDDSAPQPASGRRGDDGEGGGVVAPLISVPVDVAAASLNLSSGTAGQDGGTAVECKGSSQKEEPSASGTVVGDSAGAGDASWDNSKGDKEDKSSMSPRTGLGSDSLGVADGADSTAYADVKFEVCDVAAPEDTNLSLTVSHAALGGMRSTVPLAWDNQLGWTRVFLMCPSPSLLVKFRYCMVSHGTVVQRDRAGQREVTIHPGMVITVRCTWGREGIIVIDRTGAGTNTSSSGSEPGRRPQPATMDHHDDGGDCYDEDNFPAPSPPPPVPRPAVPRGGKGKSMLLGPETDDDEDQEAGPAVAADGPQPPTTPPPARPTGPSGKKRPDLLQKMKAYVSDDSVAADRSDGRAAGGQGDGEGEGRLGATGSGATLSPVRHLPVQLRFSPARQGGASLSGLPIPPLPGFIQHGTTHIEPGADKSVEDHPGLQRASRPTPSTDSRWGPPSRLAPIPFKLLALSPARRSPRHTPKGSTTREAFTRGPTALGMLQGDSSASQEAYLPSPAPSSPCGDGAGKQWRNRGQEDRQDGIDSPPMGLGSTAAGHLSSSPSAAAASTGHPQASHTRSAIAAATSNGQEDLVALLQVELLKLTEETAEKDALIAALQAQLGEITDKAERVNLAYTLQVRRSTALSQRVEQGREYERMVHRLTQQLQEKDDDIERLKTRLEETDQHLTRQAQRVCEEERQESTQLRKQVEVMEAKMAQLEHDLREKVAKEAELLKKMERLNKD